ncbi:hypothetical protein JRO89_XS14G0005100 [Xanthoceras sorbifolium]|uniref:Uncharacterized protein n=1 Tax=Xanthoceras sorbifolium TaxID=99658 RepID=A0ABQ8H343_9ROSI|nr:hypothetical protein JRO89_XS14G0005100 [Xanthoceras sorbifolium]
MALKRSNFAITNNLVMQLHMIQGNRPYVALEDCNYYIAWHDEGISNRLLYCVICKHSWIYHSSMSLGIRISNDRSFLPLFWLCQHYLPKVMVSFVIFRPKVLIIYMIISIVVVVSMNMFRHLNICSDDLFIWVTRLRYLCVEGPGTVACQANTCQSAAKVWHLSLIFLCLDRFLMRHNDFSLHAPLYLGITYALSSSLIILRKWKKLYMKVSGHLKFNEVKDHMESVLFKEAGVIAGVFCNQYISVDEKNKGIVENCIWNYCQDIYVGHRQVALLLRGREDGLLQDLEKIAESAFLMVVVFSLAVIKHRLNSKFSQETQMDTSVRILVSFSCLEYFRRVCLPEYMDTIRGVKVSVQENESACLSFVESMPPYVDLTNGQDFPLLRKMEYVWSKDEVQTARILFYMRVMPTCIERITATVFSRVVAPIMYMGHPNEEVARASHSMFVGFISSGKESDHDNRVSSKEQLVFYYIKRSLEGYPGSTPFKGMASGVAALVRHLPAGSPATFYCINSLVEKANELCNEAFTHEADVWKNWQGESEPCKEIFELLLRLISLIDRQASNYLIISLLKFTLLKSCYGQNLVLNKLYSLVAESDDVRRKPTLVSWLQSLSYLCSQANSRGANFTGVGSAKDLASALTTDSLNLNATSSSFGFAGNPGFSSSSSPFGSSISAAKPFSSAPTFRLNTGTSLSEANSISSGSGTTPTCFW